MKGIKRYISKNWIWIITGLIFTGDFANVAYAERGYLAYGGEWLTLPLILMLVEMARNVEELAKSLSGTEEDHESERDR